MRIIPHCPRSQRGQSLAVVLGPIQSGVFLPRELSQQVVASQVHSSRPCHFWILQWCWPPRQRIRDRVSDGLRDCKQYCLWGEARRGSVRVRDGSSELHSVELKLNFVCCTEDVDSHIIQFIGRVVFTNNQMFKFGGALYVDSANVVADGCSLSGNTASRGPAAYVVNSGAG